MYFPIDHHCRIQSELSGNLEKGRIACSSPTVNIYEFIFKIKISDALVHFLSFLFDRHHRIRNF